MTSIDWSWANKFDRELDDLHTQGLESYWSPPERAHIAEVMWLTYKKDNPRPTQAQCEKAANDLGSPGRGDYHYLVRFRDHIKKQQNHRA